jgi:hypothetical protein
VLHGKKRQDSVFEGGSTTRISVNDSQNEKKWGRKSSVEESGSVSMRACVDLWICGFVDLWICLLSELLETHLPNGDSEREEDMSDF